MENNHESQTIAVFGGANGWGKKIADICRHLKMQVLIVDPKDPEHSLTSRDAASQADIIFFAATDTEIRGIIDETRDLLTGKIVLDCATNKSAFTDLLKELSTTNSVCTTHPMVSPLTPASGQNILLMPLNEKSAPAKQTAEHIFRTVRMLPHELPFDKHPQEMTVVQFLPHIVQRAMIQVFGKTLKKTGTTMQTHSHRGSANFHLTELAMGRVGTLAPSISAGILIEALQTTFGRETLQLLKDAIETIETAGHGREQLEALFKEDTKRIDADESWWKDQKIATDVALEGMGNLRARSFTVIAMKDEPGVLRRICEVLERHHINMTAMHSHISHDLGPRSVRFDIGIDDTTIDWDALHREFQDINLTMKK